MPRRSARDISSVKEDGAGEWTYIASKYVDQGRLAGPVGADESNDLIGPNVE
jgi:hypothetical protein